MSWLDERFVGREKELAHVDKLIGDVGQRRVLLVSGPGGIGKTWLLKAIRDRYRGKTPQIQVADIIDLDETSLRVPEGLTLELARQIGQAVFRPYHDELVELTRLRLAGYGEEKLKAQQVAAREAFVSAYAREATQRRIVVLIDTVEAIRGTAMWAYLAGLAPVLENTVLVLAGREGEVEYGDLLTREPHFSTRILRLIHLWEFLPEETDEYFAKTDIPVGSALRSKLQLLTGGHPILLELAGEWLQREMSMPELLSMRVQDIEALDPEGLGELQRRFRRELVKTILDLSDPLGRVVLLMAHIYRHFDRDLLSYLTGLPKQESMKVIESLKDFGFVKPRPQGVVLHDRARELVIEDIWADLDATGMERQDLSRRVTEYYDKWTATEQSKVESWEQQRTQASVKGDVEAALQAIRSINEHLRDIQAIQIDRLYYAWRADLSEGYRRFGESFDIQRKTHPRSYYQALLEETREFEDKLVGAERLKVKLSRVRFLLWLGQYEEARRILEALAREEVQPISQIDLESAWAAYYEAQGELPKAVQHAEQALLTSQRSATEWRARLESTTGWMKRRMGRWDEAVTHYSQAIEKSQRKDSRGLLNIAAALNNLAFVQGLLGDWFGGLVTCQQALKVRKKYGSERDIAGSLNTLGSVYWAKEDFESALKCYDEALTYLQWSDDSRLIGDAHFGRGIAYWFARNLEESKRSFEECIRIWEDHGHVTNLPLATHDLGHIYWELGDIEGAETLFERGYQLSVKYHDYQARVDSLAGFAELYYGLGRHDEIMRYVNELKQLETEGYRFHLFAGRMERILADIAFDAGNYDKAIGLYADGLVEIGYHGGYGRYSLRNELMRLGNRMDTLQPHAVIEWCDKLFARWKQEQLETRRPEMAAFCLARRATVVEG